MPCLLAILYFYLYIIIKFKVDLKQDKAQIKIDTKNSIFKIEVNISLKFQ